MNPTLSRWFTGGTAIIAIVFCTLNLFASGPHNLFIMFACWLAWWGLCELVGYVGRRVVRAQRRRELVQ